MIWSLAQILGRCMKKKVHYNQKRVLMEPDMRMLVQVLHSFVLGLELERGHHNCLKALHS